MRDALEEQTSQGPILNCNVAAAAEWIVHGGRALFRQITNEELSDKDLRSTGSGSLYNGKAGPSPDRWRFWKQRFRELSDQVCGGGG
jgi:hypothetical protein